MHHQPLLPQRRDQGGRTVITTGGVALEITDRSIFPRHVEVTAGRHLALTISNSGRKARRFADERLAVSVVVKPGATETVQITTPRLGEYVYSQDGGSGADSPLTGTFTIDI